LLTNQAVTCQKQIGADAGTDTTPAIVRAKLKNADLVGDDADVLVGDGHRRGESQ
jgi:hypothetical protein